MAQADRDLRAFQAVLTRLETDPHPGIRHAAAWFLLKEWARNAAGRPCGPPQPKMKTSSTVGRPVRPGLAERQKPTDAARPAPE